MKKVFNLLLLSLAFGVSAQEFTMDLRMVSVEDGVESVAAIHLARKPSKLYASFKNDEMSEVIIVDSTQKKVLELIDEEDTKEAFISSSVTVEMEEPEFGVTMLYDMLSNDMARSTDYHLLTETKMIFGMKCRKVELLEEGEVVGTGFILPGYKIGLGKDAGLFLTPDGMLVELSFTEGADSFRLECVGITKGAVSNTQFSLEVPDGYEVFDDSEEE